MRVTCSGFLLGSAWLRDLSLRFPISRAPHTMRTVMDYAEVRGVYLDAFPGFPLVPNYCESKTMRRRFWAEYVCMGSRGLDFKIIYFTSLIIIYIRKFCKPKAVTTKEPQIMCKFHSLPSQLLKILSESNRVKKKKQITESILLYNCLESRWFANLGCKVCYNNGKVENECFPAFHPICYVNQSRRYDTQKKPSTFAST